MGVDLEAVGSTFHLESLSYGVRMRYLERPSLAGLSADLAWSRLVPLRKRVGVATSDDDPPLSLVLELFAYPHGLALVASTRVNETMGLAPLVDRMADIRSGRTVSADIGSEPVSGRLGDVATQVLRHLTHEELDVDDTTGDGTQEAFSVVTIVAADRLPATPGASLGDDVARALYGLASWSPTWRDDTLPDLAKAGITRPSKPQGHVVYTGDRGRVVWFPRLFGQVLRPRHTLSCYHRNQVLLALTAESLTGMLRTTRTRLASEAWFALPKNERVCAVHAGDCLVRLYRGEATSRSRAVTIQLEANGGRAAFDAIAGTLGREALGAPK
jgi:hypothetical protein